MFTIRLLPHPRRAWLSSFGLLVSMVILLGLAVAAWYRQSLFIFGTGMWLAVALALSAHLWPWAWTVPYRAWNKMGRYYGQCARLYLLGLCYLIVSAVGLAGPSKEFARNARSGSGWITKESDNGSMGKGRLQDDEMVFRKRGWIRTYAQWAMKPGELWKFALLPFFILLSTLEIDDQSHVPTKTYTLF